MQVQENFKYWQMQSSTKDLHVWNFNNVYKNGYHI